MSFLTNILFSKRNHTLDVPRNIEGVNQILFNSITIEYGESDLWNGTVNTPFMGKVLGEYHFEMSVTESYQTFNKFYPICSVWLHATDFGTRITFESRMRTLHYVFLLICLVCSISLGIIFLFSNSIWQQMHGLFFGGLTASISIIVMHILAVRNFITKLNDVLEIQ